jgi:hypothetical protein
MYTRPVICRQAHEVADGGERELDGEDLDEVGLALFFELLGELVDESGRVVGQVRLELAHRLRGERARREIAKLRVPRLVHVDEVGHLVDVPAESLVADAVALPHVDVVLGGRQSQPGTAVDEQLVVRADEVHIVVAGDGPERFDVGPVVPVHGRLGPQEIPLGPRIPTRSEPVGRMDVDGVERERCDHRHTVVRPLDA